MLTVLIFLLVFWLGPPVLVLLIGAYLRNREYTVVTDCVYKQMDNDHVVRSSTIALIPVLGIAILIGYAFRLVVIHWGGRLINTVVVVWDKVASRVLR